MEPFFFDRGRLFGVYHPPEGKTQATAVLLCYPAGQEYMRVHRGYLNLATQLAREGFPVLRFDWFGTGDSAGELEEASLQRWRSDLRAAMGALRSRSACAHFCLLGCRLGGTLALLHAGQDAGISHLVLWEPVLDGAAYLDALGALHREQAAAYSAGPLAPDEFVGFRFGADFLDGLRALGRDRFGGLGVGMTGEGVGSSGGQGGRPAVLWVHGAGVEPAYDLGKVLKAEAFVALQSDEPAMWLKQSGVDKSLVPARTLRSVVQWLKENQE